MKVLWFTNSPSLAKKRLNQISFGGGWMESLQEQFQTMKDIELGISFYSRSKEKMFSYNGSSYFVLKPAKSNNRFKNYLVRIKHTIEDEETEIQKYLEVIDKFKPDIIHIFGTEFPFGLICDRTQIPVIIWIQGTISVIVNKWFSGIPEKDLSKYSRIIPKINGYGIIHAFPRMVAVSQRELKIFKVCRYFLGRTDFDRRLVKILAPQARYMHCDEMLRDPFYENKWENPNNKDFILVSILNTNFYKGFETVYQTMKLLNQFPERNIKWKIIGSNGNEEIIQVIEKKYKLKAINTGIEYLGRKDAQEMIRFLLKANLFIHPSHIENSPNAVCEAMMLGMPIISTNVGGIPSILENNNEGILLQNGEPYSLAGCILEVLDSYHKIIELGINARKKALERHNKEKIVHSLLKIYSDIVKDH